MKCPRCNFENKFGKKFCTECGLKLIFRCPQCDSEIDETEKFCGECGYDLTAPPEPSPKELSFDEKLDKIQRYLPKGLTEKILAQRDRIEGERRQVTVMFCDMEGFTPLVQKLGPDEAYGVMDRVYEILIHKVHDYEGTINEMTGDGIMALFGAPIALEDAPQRAIRSALAIHREMAMFSDEIKKEKEGIPQIQMRVGIHTGPVVVGTLGNDLRVEFKAVGDTVNLASRMEGLAAPGSTYVTGDTFKLTEGFFRFETLGERQIKGRQDPVQVYQVIAPSSQRTRFDVGAERGLTTFVGRERELEFLLDAFYRAKAGEGQAISVTAEAGVGKSRLLYEFRKAVTNEDVTFLEGKCLSYSRGAPYHSVVDILRATFDILDGDGDVKIREKIVSSLKILGVDEASTLPYLLDLLSAKDSGMDGMSMSPEGRKDQIIEALKRIVIKGSEIRPLILTVEDLHWIDRSSEDAFTNLLSSIRGARICVIFTYRPQYVPPWIGKFFHSQVNLNRLSQEESLAMASHFLGTKHMEDKVKHLILEKTEGVPFFIEEFIRSAKDLKIIEKKDSAYRMARDIQNVSVPSTIQDVIMTRVDVLPEGAKTVLQTGSVIEREFGYELIKRVSGLPKKDVISNLAALKEAELIYERGIFPESTYVFRHALTRDVVYDSILAGTRKKLHEDIGNAIEKLYPDDIRQHYEVLAEHYIASGDDEKAAFYCKLAAKKALKTASLNNSIAYAEKRVECIERISRTDEVEKMLIDAKTTLGLYLAQLNQFNEARKVIYPIFDLALKTDYKKRLSQLHTVLGVFDHFVGEEYDASKNHLEEAISISEKIGDLLSFVLGNYWIACLFAWNCEFEESYSHFNKALQFSEASNNLLGIVGTKSTAALTYYWNGKVDSAYEVSGEALHTTEKINDLYPEGLSFTGHGVSCFGRGYFPSAVNHLLKAVDYCARCYNPFWNSASRFTLGDAYFELEEYKASQRLNDEATAVLDDHGIMPSFSNLCKIASLRAKVRNKKRDIDLESVFKWHDGHRGKLFDGWMAQYIADILLNIDDRHFSQAEHWIQKAITADSSNDMRWHLGRDYALYGELFRKKGDMQRAKEKLGEAIDVLKKCGADGWVKKYEEELDSLS